MTNEFDIPFPYLIFTGNAENKQTDAKTAVGIVHWSKNKCVGQLWLENTRVDLGLPHLSLQEAVQRGARTLIVGAAPVGGQIDKEWIPLLIEALQLGLNIASGLHSRLNSIPELAEAAAKYQKKIFDVRHYDGPIPLPSAIKRTGKRLLTVGTDCCVGKKYAALAISKALQEKNVNATFRATGQTGILISGSGIAIDDIVGDFCFAAAELLSPNAPDDHWDIIEGQGAFFHPWCAGVTLMLVHGSQPDAMVLCHNPARKSLSIFKNYLIRDLLEYIKAYQEAAQLTNPRAKVEGISLNTSQCKDKKEALELIKAYENKYQLPCFDPMLTGVDTFVEKLIERYK